MAAVQKLVITHMKAQIIHAVGERYEAATMLCLKGDFETDAGENDLRLEFAKEFEWKVLRELNADPSLVRTAAAAY